MRRISVTTGLVGAAVREWRPINVPDVLKDPRYLPMNAETRSELVVPLFYKDASSACSTWNIRGPHFSMKIMCAC